MSQEKVTSMEKNSQKIVEMFREQGTDVNEAIATTLVAAVGLYNNASSKNNRGSRKGFINHCRMTWDNVVGYRR